MDTTCIICNKSFASKQSLTVHTKTAKSCSGNTEKITYDCQYCGKKFSSPKGMKYHVDICPIKKELDGKNLNDKTLEKENDYKQEIASLREQLFNQENLLKKQMDDRESAHASRLKSQEYHFKNMEAEYKEELVSKNKTITKLETIVDQYEKQIKDFKDMTAKLQDKIERLACKAIEKKTKTTVNNTMNIEIHQMLPTQEKITEIIQQKFNQDYLIRGPKGVANFVQKEVIQGENGELLYKCYDVSRQRFVFYDHLGEEIKDYNGYKLIDMIHPEILKKSLEISKDADREYERLKEKKGKSSEEVDKMFFLKSATETQLPKCLLDIRTMKNDHTFSRELSRLIS